MQLSLESLMDAVRSADSLDELKRLIGPSMEEKEAATKRLAQLDAISEKCEWDSMTPSAEAQNARERYKSVERIQTEYENKYC